MLVYIHINVSHTSKSMIMFPLSGYGRIILALISFYYMPSSPGLAAFSYILSGFLDAFDGHAARLLNQGEYE